MTNFLKDMENIIRAGQKAPACLFSWIATVCEDFTLTVTVTPSKSNQYLLDETRWDMKKIGLVKAGKIVW